MSRTEWALAPVVAEYIDRTSLREDDLLRRLRAETAALPQAGMQISALQGQLMTLLTRLTGARRAIEIGTFTGYSSLCIARALPSNGRLLACDVSDAWTSVARRYWSEAGLTERIDLRLGPAAETLSACLANGEEGLYDLAFIDADKAGYDIYYERCLQLVRSGGLIMVDNVLWDGKVADPSENDADTVAIRTLNNKIADDPRVWSSLLPVADGLTLVLKR